MFPGITGNRDADLIIIGLGVFGWVILFKIVYSAREGLAWWLGAVLRGAVGFIIGAAVLPLFGLKGSDVDIGAWVVAGLVVATAKPRSRCIPAEVRRKVIERDLKGKRYNPRKYHIDHVWPYSKGGSNTPDNLRVIGRKENLRKGAKRPRIRDLF